MGLVCAYLGLVQAWCCWCWASCCPPCCPTSPSPPSPPSCLPTSSSHPTSSSSSGSGPLTVRDCCFLLPRHNKIPPNINEVSMAILSRKVIFNKFWIRHCWWLSYFRNPRGTALRHTPFGAVLLLSERIQNYPYIYETTLCFHVPLRNTYFVLNMITCRLTRNVIGKVWRTFF